jgi:DNA-directed RNA polymerase subunit M/transcription elongation factor TFIIS
MNKQIEEIEFCNKCYSMTKTKEGTDYICGKCGRDRRKEQLK